MYQIILTIISALGAFCAFYLLGSSRQKDKDEKTLKEYKAEAEAVIRSESQKTAKAEAEKTKADIEKYLMSKAVKIITEPAPEYTDAYGEMTSTSSQEHDEELRVMAEELPMESSQEHNEELREMAEEAETEDDALDVLKAMQADSERRAEKLRKHYEQR